MLYQSDIITAIVKSNNITVFKNGLLLGTSIEMDTLS